MHMEAPTRHVSAHRERTVYRGGRERTNSSRRRAQHAARCPQPMPTHRSRKILQKIFWGASWGAISDVGARGWLVLPGHGSVGVRLTSGLDLSQGGGRGKVSTSRDAPLDLRRRTLACFSATGIWRCRAESGGAAEGQGGHYLSLSKPDRSVGATQRGN